MRTITLTALLFAVILLSLTLISACDRFTTTSIGKIVQNPRDYNGKYVTVSGEVTDMFSLLLVKYFTIKDSTGELTVVSSRPLPQKGSKIKVSGVVNASFSLGDRQLLVLVEEGRKK